MAGGSAGARLAAGNAALEAGRWEDAALADERSAEALDGLGRALWWLRDPRAALHTRAQAYGLLRGRGEPLRAAGLALWLAQEYAEGLGNVPAARGWLRRAERLLEGYPERAEHGWLALVRAGAEPDLDTAAALTRQALAAAQRHRDLDLELRALTYLGLIEVRAARVPSGMARLDEAMAAATAEATRDPGTFGMVACTVVHACELAGDASRMASWAEVIGAFLSEHDHLPLLAFCGSCCGEVLLASGSFEPAEAELRTALRTLEKAGASARCVHPTARLAELRILQGRLEEAAVLLDGSEDLPEAVRPAVALHLARGGPRCRRSACRPVSLRARRRGPRSGRGGAGAARPRRRRPDRTARRR